MWGNRDKIRTRALTSWYDTYCAPALVTRIACKPCQLATWPLREDGQSSGKSSTPRMARFNVFTNAFFFARFNRQISGPSLANAGFNDLQNCDCKSNGSRLDYLPHSMTSQIWTCAIPNPISFPMQACFPCSFLAITIISDTFPNHSKELTGRGLRHMSVPGQIWKTPDWTKEDEPRSSCPDRP